MAIFWSVFFIAGYVDWHYRRIPNRVNALLFICAVFSQLSAEQVMPISFLLMNITIALCLSLPGYFKGVLGGGDIKLLLAVCPAWSPIFFLASFATGILVLTLLMFCSSLLRSRYSISTNKSHLSFVLADDKTKAVFRNGLPLASALCLGALLCAFLSMFF